MNPRDVTLLLRRANLFGLVFWFGILVRYFGLVFWFGILVFRLPINIVVQGYQVS